MPLKSGLILWSIYGTSTFSPTWLAEPATQMSGYFKSDDSEALAALPDSAIGSCSRSTADLIAEVGGVGLNIRCQMQKGRPKAPFK